MRLTSKSAIAEEVTGEFGREFGIQALMSVGEE